jgi:mRNA interferase RelE/StbE
LLHKALKKRLEQPRVSGSELHAELRHYYKIKLRKMVYRLVYAVEDDVLVVLVISVGKREGMAAYLQAIERLLTKRQN